MKLARISILAAGASTLHLALGTPLQPGSFVNQQAISPSSWLPHHKPEHAQLVDPAILERLSSPDFDAIQLLKELEPARAHELDEPRFLHVFAEDHGRWMTEGDKINLRRQNKKFVDLTGREHRESRLQDLVNKKRSKLTRLHWDTGIGRLYI